MRISLVSVEAGLVALGFRKVATYIQSFHEETNIYYLPLMRRSLWNKLVNKQKETHYEGLLPQIAAELAQSDMVCFSSMSDYSEFISLLIPEIRKANPQAYIVWGGVHPIIVPEHAIQHADAICTGEGEIAFKMFYDKFVAGEDFTGTPNFWFQHDGRVIQNQFLPLMTGEEMAALPTIMYADDAEQIYEPGVGFRPVTRSDYLAFNGLGYNTIWSIGCPFRCTYCGNTKFIDNDAQYRKLRHPGVEFIIRELEQAVERHPFIGSVLFHDDSFMALQTSVLEEFADEYKRRVDLPFCVYGVIPNYVKEAKLDVLVRGGMNRIRMGIQSGSARILEFYKRPSPPARVMEATETITKFTPYMIPPAYDIITDNPIETREDIRDTLQLLYDMPRPFTLNLFSLRLMPNTEMDRQFKELGITHQDMAAGYHNLAPTLANALMYLLATFKPPRFVFEWWLKKAKPYSEPQRMYPTLNYFMHAMWLFKRALNHLLHMDFALLPGNVGLMLQRLGIIALWRRLFVRAYAGPVERGGLKAQPVKEPALP